MPMYQFYCKECNKLIEAIVPLSEFDKDVRCPHCKSILKRLMSAVTFKFA